MREYRTMRSRGARRELRPWHLGVTGLVCLVIGIVIGDVRAGDGDGGGAAGLDDEMSETEGLLDDAAATTTTTTALLPPTQVRVVVLNGSGVQGAAGEQSDELEVLGYRTLEPGNADPATQTVVYAEVGFEAECEALAVAVSEQRAEQVMSAPLVDTIDSQGADCTLVLAPPGSNPTTTTVAGGATTTPAGGATTTPAGGATSTTTTA